jgi:hypothetical protein
MKRKIAVGLGSAIIILTLIMTIGVSSLFADTDTQVGENESFISRCVDAAQKGYGIVSEAIQELLGMSREEIQEEREGGSSLLEIAQSKDVTAAEITETIMEAKKDRLEEAVENGYLTQEQADERLGRMEGKFGEKINGNFIGKNGKNGGIGHRFGNCNK